MLRIGYAQAQGASNVVSWPPVSGRLRNWPCSAGGIGPLPLAPVRHAPPTANPAIRQPPSDTAEEAASRSICSSSALSVIRIDSTSSARRLVSWPRSRPSSSPCARCVDVIGATLLPFPGHCEVMPPSAVITEPVRKEEASPARNSATAAISSGVPSLPIGYFATVIASPAARSPPPRARSMGSISGVYTVPGQMTFTRTPWGARSTDMDRVSATTAPLDAQYEAKFATPTTAATDPWLMMDPPPAATIGRAAAREHRNVPLALTAKHRSQSSSVASITEPLLFTPALLYRTSTRPRSRRIWSKVRLTWSGSETSATAATARPPVPVIWAAVSLAAASARSITATAAPSRANSVAAARPIPEPAPVTTATRPASVPVIVSLPLSQRGHAAVDHDRVAGHAGQPAGGQQRDRVRDLVGRGDPSGRDPRLHLGAQLRLVEPPAGHRRVDHPRAHGVGPDARGRVVHGDRPGEHQRRALGRGVGAPAREGDQPGDGRDRDDVARPPGDHRRQHRAAAQEGPAHVHRVHPVPLLHRGFVAPGCLPGPGDPGVVDQHVDAPELARDGRHGHRYV